MDQVLNNNNDKSVKKLTKAQLIGIICFVFAMLAIFVTFTTIFILNYNKTIPYQVKFIDNGGEIYCVAEANDNFDGYRFVFDDGEQKLNFDSDNCTLRVDTLQGLTLGKAYKVSVIYLGEVEGGNSEPSKAVNFELYTYLGGTEARLDADILTWNKVENADYYEVYYSSNKLSFINVYTNQVSVKELPAGVVDIKIVAKSVYSHYRPTLKPSVQTITITKELSPFTSVEFNEQTNFLTIRGPEKVEKIEINVDGYSYFTEKFILQNYGGVYVYRLDISAIVTGGNRIGVRPVSDNEYITYNGELIFVE